MTLWRTALQDKQKPVTDLTTPEDTVAKDLKKKKAGTAVAVKNKPSTVLVKSDYGEDEGVGFETMGRDDFAIPFLAILQSNNPQVTRGHAKYIENAKAGMIYNTVTGDLYDGEDGIVVIPVHRAHTFIEWIPRDKGGGLVAVYEPEDPIIQKLRREGGRFGKLVREKEGTEVQETFSVFALNVRDEEVGEQVLINFSSSAIKGYKQWMTRAAAIQIRSGDRTVRPPLFAHRYRLTTVLNQNKKGQWYGWSINFDGNTAETSRLATKARLYEEARAFRQIAASEEVRSVGASARKAEGAGVSLDTGGTEDEDQL